jgi:hypothetical protein
MMDQACILSLSHRPLADLEFHRRWHERCGCDYKAIWQTTEKSAPDWVYAIDIPGKIVIPGKMRIYCHYARKFPQYKYFVFLDSDAFIIDPEFVAQHIARMESEKHQVLFTHMTENEEHYKAAYYGHVKKEYKSNILVWSLNVCTFIDSAAAQLYDENNNYKIYDEVDFACFARANFRCAASDRVNHAFFFAGRAEGRLTGVKDGNLPPIVHAVKDYGAMAGIA